MSKKKVLKVSLIVLGCILLLLFGLSTIVHRQIDLLVKQKISEALGEKFKVDYRKSRIGFIKKTISLENVEVSKQNDTTEFWNGEIEKLTVHGFQTLKFLSGEGVGIDSITIIRPEFNLSAFDTDTLETQDNSDTLSTEVTTKMAISVIKMHEGSFKIDRNGPEFLQFNFNLKVKDVSVSEILEKDKLDMLNHIDLTIDNFSYQFPDSVYSIKSSGIVSHSGAHAIEISNVVVHSNLSGVDYPKYYGWQKVNFDIEIPEVSIDRPTSISKDSLVIPKISIEEIKAHLAKNKNYPLPNRHTELPQYLMAQMSLKFRCDSVQINKGALLFEAIQKTNEAAKVELTEIDASILAVQNIDTLQPAFTLIAEAKLERKADLDVEIVYHYGHLDPFTVEGSIANTQLALMDDFLTKMMGIQIETGNLNELIFTMSGNTYGISGYVDFHYDNLEIHLVNKETGKDKKFINLLSNLVGGIVFWHENPSKEQFRRGYFNVERDVRKGFVSQWTDGLLYGAVNSVSKVDANKVEKTSKSIKDWFNDKKR